MQKLDSLEADVRCITEHPGFGQCALTNMSLKKRTLSIDSSTVQMWTSPKLSKQWINAWYLLSMFDTCNWKYHQLCIIHANLFGVKIHTAVSWQKFDVWKLKIINKNRRGDFEKTFNLHYYKWGICNAAWVCFIIWLFKFRINSTWPLKKKKKHFIF